MAQNIGFLNFGIDGDDKAIKAKIDALKKDAVSLEQIFKNIKIDSGGNLSKDTQKAQLSADKLAISNAKVAQSISDMERASVRLGNEKARSAEIDSRTAVNSLRQATEKQRQDEVALNMEIRKQRVNNVTAESMARKAAIEQKMQEQSMMNEARLEGIRKRNEEIGKRGQENFRKAVDGANKSLQSQNSILTNLEKKLIGVFSTYQIARFAKEIVNVRGEFQGLELAFTTMLGSAEKSRKMMVDVTSLALESPYTVTEVASNTKQLIAMGIQAEKAMDTMKALGDVSAGVSVPMWRVAINYGQVSALGRLQAREIRDFAMAGIPIVDELAKVLGKTSAEITSMVSAGKIGFPEVEKAFQSMAGEGGKFHNMMEKQNSTVKGQMNRLQDQVELMMNNIGKSSEGAIYGAINMASTLVENYETIGKTIVSLVAVYGTYKGILMATTVVEKARKAVLMQTVMNMRLATAANETLSKAEAASTARTKLLTSARKSLMATLTPNPYLLIATAIVGMSVALYKAYTNTTELEDAQNRLSEQQTSFYKAVSESESELSRYNDQLIDAKGNTEEFEKVKDKIVSKYGVYYDGLDGEITRVGDLSTVYETLNGIISENIAKRELASAKDVEVGRFESVRSEKMATLRKRLMSEFDDIDEVSRIYKEASDYVYRNIEMSVETEKTLKQAGMWSFGGQLYQYVSDIKKEADATELVLSGLDRIADEYDVDITPNKPQAVNEEKEVIGLIKEKEQALEALKDRYGEIENITDKQTLKTYNQEKAKLEKEIKELKDLGIESSKKQKKKPLDIQDDIDKAQLDVRKQSTDDKLELLKIEEEQELKSLEKKYKEAVVSEEKKNELINLINEKYSIQRADIVKSELEREQELWNKYLAEYGTFQQQKLAVTNEYEHKISKAKSDVERKSLEKERDTKLSKIEVSAIKSEIDWVTVFGKFGGMFKDLIADTLAKTKEYTKTDEFKNADHASQKEVVEAQNKMERAVGGSSLSKNFKELGESVQKYHDAEKTLLDLRDKEKVAMDRATKALDDYSKALKEGTDQEREIARIASDKAEKESEEASNAVQSQVKITKASQDNVSESASRLNESMNDVTDGLSKMSSNKLSNIYEGFIQGSKGIGGAMEKVSDKLESVPIIGWIASIIDIFKEGLSFVIGGILDAVFNAVSGIIEDVLSGDLFVTIGKSIASGVSKIFDAVSFGGFSKLTNLINGGNAKEVQRTTNRLTASNKVLKQSIDALKDEMARAKGLETVEVSKELKSKEKELRDNTSELLATQMGYVGSHHSNNYYLRKAMDSSDWDKISKKVGKNVSSTSDLWALSPEDLKKVSTLTEVWDKIYNSGKYDKSKYLDDYLKLAGGLEEITKNLQETLTQTTFDGVYNEFIDMLMDMDVSAENFAENFSEYMMKAMLSNKVGTLFMGRIEDWYKDFALRMEDGELSPTDIKELKEVYSNIADEALELRDNLAKASGYDQKGTSKSTLSKGIQEVTEDTASLLASYINSMRADVAVTKEQLLKIVQMAQYSQASLGGMLAQLLLIQTNTLNTANNTQRANEIAEKTFDLLKSATTNGGITQFNVR